MTDPSNRLIEVLITHARGLQPRGLADLASALEAGRHEWFPAEFEAAVADDAIGPRMWDRIVGSRGDNRRPDRQRVWAELEQLWHGVLPGRPFPERTRQAS